MNRPVRATKFKSINAEATPKQIDISLDENNLVATLIEEGNLEALADLQPTAAPNAVVVNDDGSRVWLDDSRSLVLRGIYELDGDKLQYCFAQPGKERPSEFKVTKGSGHTLVRLKRFSTGEGPLIKELAAAGVHAQQDDIGWVTGLQFSRVPGRLHGLFAKAVSFRKLRSVYTAEQDLTDADFRQLSKIPTLRELIVQNTDGSVTGLAAFKPTGPMELLLRGKGIDDAALQGASVNGLVKLSVQRTSLSAGGLADFIDRHPELIRVDLVGVQVDAKLMIALAESKRLRELHISGGNFNDDYAEHVARSGSLAELSLWNTKITDGAVKKLTELKQLTRLILHGTQVTDEGLRLIAVSFPKLATLQLSGKGNRFTNDGLRALVNHPSLDWISTEKPLDDAVRQEVVDELRRRHREREKAAEEQ